MEIICCLPFYLRCKSCYGYKNLKERGREREKESEREWKTHFHLRVCILRIRQTNVEGALSIKNPTEECIYAVGEMIQMDALNNTH